MKIIIAGSRHLTGDKVKLEVWKAVAQAIDKWDVREVTEIVTGGAAGIDSLGEQFAEQFRIAHKRFDANWDEFGKSAGPKRNAEMAEYADALILVWDGKSRGSLSMRWEAEKRKMPIYEVILE
jgi:hypothetical protein